MPAAPALVDLTVLTAVLVVIALILLVRALADGILSPLTGIPFIGGAFRAVRDAMVHALNAALGAAVRTAQITVGASWHALARSSDWLWREIRSHANLFTALAGPVGLLWTAYTGIRALVHRLTATNHHAGLRLKSLTRELGRLERRERALRRELEKGIGEDVLPRIKSLDRKIATLRTRTIPAIRAQEAENEGAIDNLYEWAKGKASLLGVGTFAFAVAAVLDRLGLGGIKCSSFGNMFNKRGCGLWNDLEGLLGLLADTVLLTNVCTLLPILETAVSDVADPVVVALTDVGAGLCSGGIGAPPPLPIPGLSLPATAGVSLSLP